MAPPWPSFDENALAASYCTVTSPRRLNYREPLRFRHTSAPHIATRFPYETALRQVSSVVAWRHQVDRDVQTRGPSSRGRRNRRSLHQAILRWIVTAATL